MDNDSGESMELMQGVPLKKNWQNWRDQCGLDGGKQEVDSRDEEKHTERNDLLFVKKIMWMGERDQR